jgi:hypothetical protein
VPTTTIEYDPTKGYDEILDRLADEIPGIVAPQMNVSGRKLHDGGVSESEIIVRFMEFSPRDRNTNDIQITTRAHRFEERVARCDESTEAIKRGVMNILRDFDRNIEVGIELDLVEMGYAKI